MHTQISEAQSSGGFDKEIDEDSKELLFRLTQRDQYTFPEQSAMRELVCNAADSIKEKLLALDILQGRAKSEDYWLQREEAQYRASNWNPEYYDPEYLSLDKNTVQVTYRIGPGVEKDTLIIEDNGVGLGDYRLSGYMKLAWSTKRNSKAFTGRFGLGAKAPLALGVPFYTMISRYNGLEYSFNIYERRYESNIPEEDIMTGIVHVPVLFGPIRADGTQATIYARPYHGDNGVTVIIPGIKKHHKDKYTAALQQQLLYFDNVTYSIESPTEIGHNGQTINEGNTRIIPVTESIIYENDIIILAQDNKVYSRPHLVLNRVCYGTVNFQELEIPEKLGNIGIKVTDEEVELVPSRESVIWSGTTRATVLKRFQEVVDLASYMVNTKLKDATNIMEWLNLCSALLNNTSAQGDNILGRLAAIVDIKDAKPTFPPDPKIQFNNDPRKFFMDSTCRLVRAENVWKGGTNKRTIVRVVGATWSAFNNITKYVDTAPALEPPDSGEPDDAVTAKAAMVNVLKTGVKWYYQKGVSTTKRDTYITDLADQFISVSVPNEFLDDDGNLIDLEDIPEPEIPTLPLGIPEDRALILAKMKQMQNHRLLSYLLPHMIFYDNIKVPVSYDTLAIDGDEVDSKAYVEMGQHLTPAQIRLMEQKTIAYTMKVDPNVLEYKENPRVFTYSKLEPRIVDAQSMENVVYATSSEEDEKLLHFLSGIIRTQKDFSQYKTEYSHQLLSKNLPVGVLPRTYDEVMMDFMRPDIKLLKIARENIKYYPKAKHIANYLVTMDPTTKTLNAADTVVRWNTARIIANSLNDLRFLSNYDFIDQSMSDKYKELTRYVDDNYRSVSLLQHRRAFGFQEDFVESLTTQLDELGNFQLYVREAAAQLKGQTEKDFVEQIKADITDRAMGLFHQDMAGATALELPVYDLLQEVMDYASGLSTLLNQVVSLITQGAVISPELESEIKAFVDFKKN